MRKKKLEKLKADIKKELIKDMQLEEERNKKKEKEELEKYREPVVIEHTPEDLYSIRKNFLIVFLFSSSVIFIILVILLINPFDKKTKRPEKPEEEVVEKEEEGMSSLYKFEDGIIPNNNEYVLMLFNLFEYTKEDYYDYDNTYIYVKENLEISNIDKEYLMFLMTKTYDFEELMSEYTRDLTGIEICNNSGAIKIPVSEIEKIVTRNFNTQLDNYPTFIYNYYYDGMLSAKIGFSYSDDFYVSICRYDNENEVSNIRANPIIKEAIKKDETLTITAKIPFIYNDKVYSDYTLTNEISNSSKNDFLEYINSASTYSYVFIYDNNNYKLDKIVRVS